MVHCSHIYTSCKLFVVSILSSDKYGLLPLSMKVSYKGKLRKSFLLTPCFLLTVLQTFADINFLNPLAQGFCCTSVMWFQGSFGPM